MGKEHQGLIMIYGMQRLTRSCHGWNAPASQPPRLLLSLRPAHGVLTRLLVQRSLPAGA